MKDEITDFLNNLSSVKFTFRKVTFPLPDAPPDDFSYRLQQLQLRFPGLHDYACLFYADNPGIYDKIMQSSLSTEQALNAFIKILGIKCHPTNVIDDFPKLTAFFDKFSFANFHVLLYDSLTWRLIWSIFLIIFLFLFYFYSENQRFHPFKDDLLLDTRSGILYVPAHIAPTHKLTPVTDFISNIPPPKKEKSLVDILTGE